MHWQFLIPSNSMGLVSTIDQAVMSRALIRWDRSGQDGRAIPLALLGDAKTAMRASTAAVRPLRSLRSRVKRAVCCVYMANASRAPTVAARFSFPQGQMLAEDWLTMPESPPSRAGLGLAPG